MKHSFQAGLCVVVLSALFAGGTNAAGSSRTGSVDAVETDSYADEVWYSSLQREQSGCRRYSVTWSGGIALRGPDRISPRPVRSRWQDPGASRVRCQGGDAFSQRRVSARPWIR